MKKIKIILSITLILGILIPYFAGLATINVNAATEYVTMSVGSTKTLYLNAGVAVNSAAWYSNAPSYVRVNSQSSVSCTVEAVASTSSRVIVRCDYYYIEYFNGYAYMRTGFKDFYIDVNGGSSSGGSYGSPTRFTSYTSSTTIDLSQNYSELLVKTNGVCDGYDYYIDVSCSTYDVPYSVSYGNDGKNYLKFYYSGSSSLPINRKVTLELMYEQSSSLTIIKDRITIYLTFTCSHASKKTTVVRIPTDTQSGREEYVCPSCKISGSKTITSLDQKYTDAISIINSLRFDPISSTEIDNFSTVLKSDIAPNVTGISSISVSKTKYTPPTANTFGECEYKITLKNGNYSVEVSNFTVLVKPDTDLYSVTNRENVLSTLNSVTINPSSKKAADIYGYRATTVTPFSIINSSSTEATYYYPIDDIETANSLVVVDLSVNPPVILDTSMDHDYLIFSLKGNRTLAIYECLGTPGDIDNDGTISPIDSNLLKRCIAGNVTDMELFRCDYNGDNSVNSVDSYLLKHELISNG